MFVRMQFSICLKDGPRLATFHPVLPCEAHPSKSARCPQTQTIALIVLDPPGTACSTLGE
jgi:hypothetical protein